ncbi:unnamed protein product [Strongylus vulgaris]|uniref:MULE transposase domain-containing protein n=1 Tax=Strongylus vulgaris TaxID=40348 RepID=A0A3P7IMK0_STRVU|nr:unnamed protein product [Strongylus vulgaris]
MDKGQLYILHAVISGGIEVLLHHSMAGTKTYHIKTIYVPLLYAIARYKNVNTYKDIFGQLSGPIRDGRLRFILDYEKAAIRAAKETFPNADVQGCAFHQARNRKTGGLGLRQFIKEPKKIGAVMI